MQVCPGNTVFCRIVATICVHTISLYIYIYKHYHYFRITNSAIWLPSSHKMEPVDTRSWRPFKDMLWLFVVVVVVLLLLLLMVKLLANALSTNQGESIKKKTIVFLPDYPRRSPHESKVVPSVALVPAKVWGWHISGIQWHLGNSRNIWHICEMHESIEEKAHTHVYYTWNCLHARLSQMKLRFPSMLPYHINFLLLL